MMMMRNVREFVMMKRRRAEELNYRRATIVLWGLAAVVGTLFAATMIPFPNGGCAADLAREEDFSGGAAAGKEEEEGAAG